MRAILLLLSLMSWDKGFNFRSTSAYVADGANETYVLGTADSYPTTRNGVTFGWTPGAPTADRNAGIAVELAGINYQVNNGSQTSFKVDLPTTGVFNVRLGLGDASFAQGYQYAQVKDSTTALLTVDDASGTLPNGFDDAMGTEYTAANWPSSNSPSPLTFASTVFSLIIGSPVAQADASTLAHLFISQVPTAAPPRLARIMAPQQRMCA